MSYSTNNPYEKEFGYVRATRRGDCIYVSGTTSVDPEPPHAIRAPGDARNQTRIAFEESLKAIEALGGSRSDIYRVRMFVAEDKHCNDVGIAMREFFADQGVQVVATMLTGTGFLDPKMLVEVEVEAFNERRV